MFDLLHNDVSWSELAPIIRRLSGIELVKTGDEGWLSIDHKLPYSINDVEFNLIKNHIVKEKYTYGFDLATGIGIAALAVGYATKVNGGKALSMDSYFEELSGHIVENVDHGSVTHNAQGYRLASWLKDKFRLSNLVLAVGWSPNDATKYIKEHLDGRVDFAVLDCPKNNQDLRRDLEMLRPFLPRKYSIFIHDLHTFENVYGLVQNVLGRVGFCQYPTSPKYSIGLVVSQ